MSASRLLSTEWPIPAEASTATDSVVTTRMAQRGFPRGAGGRDGRPDGCERRCGRSGERGGVGTGNLRTTAVRGSVSTVGRYDLPPGAAHPAGRRAVPRSR
ncbi:hypothetical protein GCM10018783_54180 [Streptomyces griseosporeus]|nr:hypothetical protein GCM10018783_54180 [Streptomyces griseosporeus]